MLCAFRQPLLHHAARALVPVRARGIWRELYRARACAHRLQCHLDRAADAHGFSAAWVWIGRGDPPEPVNPPAKPRSDQTGAALDGWRLLLSPAIFTNMVFFILLSFCGGGLNNYLVVGLGALYDTPFAVASTALTSQLTMSAVGVLVGGILAMRTTHHGLVAACGLLATAAACTLVGLVDFPALALVLMM